jgi:hypothetical protein
MGSLILLLSATVGLQDLERGLQPGRLLQAFSHVRLKMRQKIRTGFNADPDPSI